MAVAQSLKAVDELGDGVEVGELGPAAGVLAVPVQHELGKVGLFVVGHDSEGYLVGTCLIGYRVSAGEDVVRPGDGGDGDRDGRR